MFKVGDTVRKKDSGNMYVIDNIIGDAYYDKLTGYIGCQERANLELWQPIKGEWYFDNINKELLKCDYVEYVGGDLYAYGTTAKDKPFSTQLNNCEPYFGTLPKFAKE